MDAAGMTAPLASVMRPRTVARDSWDQAVETETAAAIRMLKSCVRHASMDASLSKVQFKESIRLVHALAGSRPRSFRFSGAAPRGTEVSARHPRYGVPSVHSGCHRGQRGSSGVCD